MAAKKKSGSSPSGRKSKPKPSAEGSSGSPRLLSGGNPQIAKGDGCEPVEAYLKAMPDWKQAVGRRIDELTVQAVPGVRKAVRWNSPFYGIDGRGWFLSFHCMTRYIKVAFLNGGVLVPLPPVESKQKSVRYLHIAENEPLDEQQLVDWVRQAASHPGEPLF